MQNACGHMYLDQGEELNLTRSLNNYINMASQVVLQVGSHLLSSEIALLAFSGSHIAAKVHQAGLKISSQPAICLRAGVPGIPPCMH